MLHIILLILKILGILILALLGLILTVLLLFLLVPVRYRLWGQYEGQPRGRAAVSWLLHILSVRLVYEEQAVLTVRIFGIKVLRRQVWPEEEPDVPEEEEFISKADVPDQPGASEMFLKETGEPSMVRMTGLDEAEELVPVPESGTEKTQNEAEIRKAAETGKEAEIPAPVEPPKESAERSKTVQMEEENDLIRRLKRVYSWFSGKLAGIKKKFQNIRRSLRHAEKKYQKMQDFINNEENRKTFRLLLRQTKKLLKHLLPRRVNGRICFGFEDPYYTGQVLTAVSPFYGLYAKSFSLEPVFGEKALEGEVKIIGYIRPGTLIFIVLRVFANKNFRILLKKWRG